MRPALVPVPSAVLGGSKPSASTSSDTVSVTKPQRSTIDSSGTPIQSGGQAQGVRSQLEALGTLRRQEFPVKRRFELCFTSPLLFVIAGACVTSSQNTDRDPEYYKIVEKSTPEQDNEVITAANNIPPPPKGEEVTCEYEDVLGSHIPRKICRAKSEEERTRAETQEYWKKLRPYDRIPSTP
jgi:hypothetical protein